VCVQKKNAECRQPVTSHNEFAVLASVAMWLCTVGEGR